MTDDHYEGLRVVLGHLVNLTADKDRVRKHLLILDLSDVLRFARAHPECVKAGGGE